MSMYELFKTDASLEAKGVAIDYGTFRITIARASATNKRYVKVLEAKTKPYKRAIQTETIDPEIVTKILRETFAETVILNWEVKDGEKFKVGIEGVDGKTIPFTKENVITTFVNLPELFTDIQTQATNFALFRSDIQEAELGNS